MSSMIYSSAHHAKSVELFKGRLRAGMAVDAMDDTGRWVKARIVQMDESWGKCKIKWDGVYATQEEWIALDRDRLRPPGEMTRDGVDAGHSGASHTASYLAHVAAAQELRKEALVLWLFAALLAATALLWCDGLIFYVLLIAAALTAWLGAIPRTLRAAGEGFKATLSDSGMVARGADSLFHKVQFWWWLGRGCKVDFLNRSGQWVRGQVLQFPFPWRSARVEFVGAAGKKSIEWVAIYEQRLAYPGQMTTAQEHQHRAATPQGELSGTISSQLLEMSARSANADPRGHTPTSARLDGLRDGGGYAESPGFSVSGAVSPGFGTPFSPFGGISAAPSPAPGFAGTPGGSMRSPVPSSRDSFAGLQSPMRGGFTSPMSATISPASALGATLNTSGVGARIFDDITNEAELRQYEDAHPLESTVRRASLAASPGRTDATAWGRSPSPVRGTSLQRSSIGGLDGYANAGDAIQEYHAGEVRTSGQTTTGRANSSGSGTRQTIESPDALIPRLARECSHQPSPWSRNPQEDILRWSWQVQRWVEINLIQFVGRNLFDTEFLTMARGPHHAKAKALFCDEVRGSLDTDQLGRQVPSEFNTLWNTDQGLHQVKGIGELTIHELMRQQAPANAQFPGMGMLMNAGGMLGVMGGARKSSVGSSGGDGSLLDYICVRLPRQGKRLRELQRQQHFLDSHGLSDSKNSRAVFIVQRLKTLAHCANVWDTRHAPSSYTWNGGFHDNHKWILPHRPGPNFPTDAEILFELFLSKESSTPLDAEHATIGRHVVTLQDGSRAPEDHLRRRGNLATGGAFLAAHSEQGLQLSVIAPKGAPNAALPVWQVPPGQSNLPVAIALFVYYMTYVDDELGERGLWLPNAEQQRAASGPGGSSGSSVTASASSTGADGKQGMCYLLASESAGGSSWGLLRREIFNGLMLNNGPRDARVDGMAPPLSDAELQQRLGAREAARHAGDFEQAARLLEQLRVRGVWLDDSTGRWTTSDGRGGLYPASATSAAGGAGHVGSSWAGLSTATTSAVATTVSDTAATWRGLPLLFGMGSIELSSLGVAALRCFSAAPYQRSLSRGYASVPVANATGYDRNLARADESPPPFASIHDTYGGGRQSLGSAARRSDSYGDGARRRRAAHQALDRTLDQQEGKAQHRYGLRSSMR